MRTYATRPKETPPAAHKAQQSFKTSQPGTAISSPVTGQAGSVSLPPVFGKSAGVLKVQQLKGNRAVSQMLAVQQTAEVQGVREPSDEEIHSAAAEGIRTPATTLPFLDRIQASFGRHSIGHVKAHVGAEAAKASRAMNALAFASGDHVVFDGTPDLRTAAHEAAHVVQQQGGVQLEGGIGREGDSYERHADAAADAVVAGRSAEGLLGLFEFTYAVGGPATSVTEGEFPRVSQSKGNKCDRSEALSKSRDSVDMAHPSSSSTIQMLAMQDSIKYSDAQAQEVKNRRIKMSDFDAANNWATIAYKQKNGEEAMVSERNNNKVHAEKVCLSKIQDFLDVLWVFSEREPCEKCEEALDTYFGRKDVKAFFLVEYRRDHEQAKIDLARELGKYGMTNKSYPKKSKAKTSHEECKDNEMEKARFCSSFTKEQFLEYKKNKEDLGFDDWRELAEDALKQVYLWGEFEIFVGEKATLLKSSYDNGFTVTDFVELIGEKVDGKSEPAEFEKDKKKLDFSDWKNMALKALDMMKLSKRFNKLDQSKQDNSLKECYDWGYTVNDFVTAMRFEVDE